MFFRYINAILIMSVMVFSGCKKFLEIPPPNTDVQSSTIFNNDATATAAMVQVYADIALSNSFNLFNTIPNLSADEFLNYAQNVAYKQLNENQLQADNPRISELWTFCYQSLYRVNAIINNTSEKNDLTEEVRLQLNGEARFIRAFINFYLVNFFGEVPNITGTRYQENVAVSRVSEEAIFNQIIVDLTTAEAELSENYVGPNSLGTSEERTRPNKYAASALLARVYLYIKDWEKAEIESSKVIDNQSAYSIIENYDEVFLKNSHEAIWQIYPYQQGFNTDEGLYYNALKIFPPGTDGLFPAALRDEFVREFEPNDMRTQKWLDSAIYGSTVYYFPFKYKVLAGGDVTEYEMVMRLAEQYLIRAEARAHLQKIPEGKADLNIIRSRAALPDTDASTEEELINAVLKERSFELFSEFGHRWLDLKRSEMIDSVMSAAAVAKGSSWSSFQQLYPIPADERSKNPMLTQNPGY